MAKAARSKTPSRKKSASTPKMTRKPHQVEGQAGLADLFLHGLKDIYYAEKKLTKALPKLIKKARSQDLIDALTSHLAETEEHAGKVEKIFASIEQSPRATKCDAIDGIVKEAESILEDFGKTAACDAAIIFAGQAAEHYEITRYGSLKAFAKVLKYGEAQKLIESILEQEKAADAKLTQIAEDRVDYAAAGNDANGPEPTQRETSDKSGKLFSKINWRLWQ